MYQIFNSIRDYICILNADNEIIFCNKSLCSKLKYKNLQGKSLGEITLPNKKWVQSKSQQKDKTLLTFKTSQGEEVILCTDHTNGLDYTNDYRLFVFYPFEDLYYTKEDLEQVLDNIPFHIWLKNKEFDYIYINKTYANWLNSHLSPKQLLGDPECLYWSDDLLDYFRRTDLQVFEDNQMLVMPEVLNVDAQEVYWKTYKIPLCPDSTHVTSVLGLNYIPSNKNQLEVSLAHANRQLHILYDITKQPIADLDLQSILQHISNLITQYLDAAAVCISDFDTTTNEFIIWTPTGNFKELFSTHQRIGIKESEINKLLNLPNDFFLLDVNKLYESDSFYNQLTASLQKSDIHCIHTYPIKNDNELLGLINIGYEDIYSPDPSKAYFMQTICSQISSILKNAALIKKAQSEIKKREVAEAQALELEKAISMESMRNEFFTNISHELKTPINILLSTNSLLEYFYVHDMISSDTQVDFKKYIHILKQNSYRLLRLINNLIDITKIDASEYPLRLEVHNIIHLIEETTLSIKDYIETKKIQLIFDTTLEECFMYCDDEKIERILLNLLSNAVKYSNQGDSIFVTITQDDSYLIISIKDTGIGIPSDKLQVIFQRFGQVNTTLTRPAEGSGIGLSIVHALVTMHQGFIEANSVLGEGSEFIIKLPLPSPPLDSSFIPNESSVQCTISQNSIERCHIEFSDIYY